MHKTGEPQPDQLIKFSNLHSLTLVHDSIHLLFNMVISANKNLLWHFRIPFGE